ncbi:hypothetical protein, partial [Pedobacter namyangjuensis]|uniref:hypothetical protein n=1 Tax=Pedobacter namyangjuensis TaxID=600626 RepID=UPI0019633DF5
MTKYKKELMTSTKNTIKLHEAIAIILLNLPGRRASFDTIATEIEKRNLFPNRAGNIPLAKQIKLRSAIK